MAKRSGSGNRAQIFTPAGKAARQAARQALPPVARAIGAQPDPNAFANFLAFLNAVEAQQQQQAAQQQSYSGGDGGSSFAAPAPRDLNSDPGWLAYNAEADRQEALLGTDADRRKGFIGSERDRLLADLEPRGEEERQGIEGGYESRGLFGGGAQQEAIARQRANQGRRAAGIQSDAAARVSDIEGELAQRLAQSKMARAQQRASFLSQGYI